MAAVTTAYLLLTLQQACYRSSMVDRVDVQTIDADTLSACVYLLNRAAFIDVFHNLATAKTSFALIENGKRSYGVDNAKMRWHVHPFDNPTQHTPSAPVQFEDFLAAVEAYYHQSSAQ